MRSKTGWAKPTQAPLPLFAPMQLHNNESTELKFKKKPTEKLISNNFPKIGTSLKTKIRQKKRS